MTQEIKLLTENDLIGLVFHGGPLDGQTYNNQRYTLASHEEEYTSVYASDEFDGHYLLNEVDLYLLWIDW
jgi:hypothetical protein